MIDIYASPVSNVNAMGKGFAKIHIQGNHRMNYTTIYYQDSLPVVITRARRKFTGMATDFVRLATDKASVLQLRRMKTILDHRFTETKELQMEDLKMEALQAISDAIAAHMDEMLTAKGNDNG